MYPEYACPGLFGGCLYFYVDAKVPSGYRMFKNRNQMELAWHAVGLEGRWVRCSLLV